jgi:hypothetical protein
MHTGVKGIYRKVPKTLSVTARATLWPRSGPVTQPLPYQPANRARPAEAASMQLRIIT